MKNEYRYAYSVARTKAAEKRLLGSGFCEQLIAAPSYAAAVKLLKDNGWELSDKEDAMRAVSERLSGAWELLVESAPDRTELSVLTVENDFHNLKAAVKSIFSGVSPEKLYLAPASVDTQLLSDAAAKHDFSALPEYAGEAAKKAYEVGAQTGNGQRIDMILDAAALKRLRVLSEQSGCELLQKTAQIKIACADLKTAVRCASAGKDAAFVQSALGECRGIDVDSLSLAATKGVEAVLEVAEKTPYGFLAGAMKESAAAFEKAADDGIMRLMKQYKWKTLGVEPLICWYYANVTETKNIRIILGAKKSGASEETIRQRVRELYD